ncbi:BF3164 family lipoprotein [uncultured Rikenella sp.]|uniref:BF3164 family lipoprotein n=1 Tax=uncultured Rikenella sp. TaxID=368003 RepID=UPI00262A6AB5|nr:BF3164 family lipoprotein [uncultured Rikenella sp.]
MQDITKDSRAVAGHALPIQVILAHPYQIQYMNGCLLWVDRTKNKLLTIYDLHKRQVVTQVINQGKGPNEVLPPLQLQVDSLAGTVGLLQRRTGQYVELRFSDLLCDSIVPVRQFSFDGGADRCLKLSSDSYLFTYIFPDTVASACISDTTGKPLRWINTFPSEILELQKPDDRYIKGQSPMAYHAKRKTLCLAYSSLDKVQFYDLSGHTPMLIREYSIPGLDQEYTPHAQQTVSTENHIYVLRTEYPGKKRYIIQFDCEGGVRDCIEVGPETYRFCVTPDDTKIYTLEQDSAAMPVVAEYRLR